MPPKSAKNSKYSSKKNNKCTPEPHIPPQITVDMNSTSGLNPEAEDQFELELCWCIQQLETSLASGKLQEKQAQDLSKHLRLLKSNTAPLIKKRQIMRNTLGDYKVKMTENEQKLSKTISNVKFTNPSEVNKSVFIKKATKYSEQERQEQTDNYKMQETLVNTTKIINIDRIQTPFQFNFQTCQ